MPIETYKCLIFRGYDRYEFMAFKFELHAALSLVGFQNNNRPFPVRQRTFGELANGLCEWPVVVLNADQ